MSSPKVSIIMCAYNSENCMHKAIESVLNQSLKDIELVLVNDGSKDSSLKIMNEYAAKDSRIKVVSQENKGLGLARNTGIENATGEYITFADTDDWLEQNAYERAYNCSGNGYYDAIIFNFVKVFSENNKQIIRNIKEGEIDLDKTGKVNYILKYLMSYTHEYGVTNKIFKRSIIMEHGLRFPDNKKVLHEDILFNLKFVTYAKKVYAIPDGLYNYYIHEGTLSDMKKAYKGMVSGYSNIVAMYRQHLCENNQFEEMKDVLPLLYYSLVYFGLIRVKHFGHIDITGCAREMTEFPNYKEYMSALSNWKVRGKYLTHTMMGVGTVKNWQLNGLLVLTQVQAKIIAHYALKDDYKKVEKWM